MISITREAACYPGYRGVKPLETVIGTFTVTEAYTMRTSEQTACNYYEIRVDPGTYEVCKTRDWVFVRIEGEIVDEHFVNRLFSASSLAEPRSIGQRSNRATRQMYDYNVAEQFATSPDWELADDWTVTMVTRHFDDGRAYKSYKLAPAS